MTVSTEIKDGMRWYPPPEETDSRYWYHMGVAEWDDLPDPVTDFTTGPFGRE